MNGFYDDGSMFGFDVLANNSLGSSADPWIAGSQLALDAAVFGYNIWNNERNFDEQLKGIEYQKWLNKELMNREDNAVSRRVKDLVKSGLNPVLAAGSGASSSSGTGYIAPQHERMEKFQSMLATAQAMQQLEMNRTQMDLTRAETFVKQQQGKKEVFDYNYLKPIQRALELVNLSNATKDGYNKDLNNEYLKWDNDISYGTGISKDTGRYAKYLRDSSFMVYNTGRQILDNSKRGVSKFIQWFRNLPHNDVGRMRVEEAMRYHRN